MAHLAKATRLQVVGLINHDTRKLDNHSNECIVKERSVDNYNLHKGDPLENYNARLEQIKVLKRKDVNTLGELCITLPKELVNEPKNAQEEFFKSCYSFAKQDYGENNLVSAIVHNDETTPHIHIKFIPVVEDKKTGQEKCSMKEKCPREYYQKLHERLKEHTERELKRELSIVNGETIENKSIKELKQQITKNLDANIQNQKEQIKKELEREKEIFKNNTKKLENVLEPTKKEILSGKQFIDYEEYVRAKKQVATEREYLKEKQDKILDLKKSNLTLQDKYHNLLVDSQDLLNNNKYLKKENQKLKTRKGVKEIIDENTNLKAQVKELKTTNQNLVIENAELRNNNNKLSNELQESNRIVEWYRKSFGRFRDTMANYLHDYGKDDFNKLFDMFNFGDQAKQIKTYIFNAFDSMFKVVKRVVEHEIGGR